MGNCLVSASKFVQVMKIDGERLEYKVPVKVYQVLSEFPGHSISDSLPVRRHLSSDTDMHGGCLYYLLPPLLPATAKVMNNVKEKSKGTGLVRIKIVMTKQELREMLAKEIQSVDEIVCQMQNKENRERYRNCGGWKPVLDSITE
ncbi:hypothetical protein ACHQM5_021184 [Ranunculus cassubicifolius]